MKQETWVVQANIPSVEDLAAQYRQYGPLAQGAGRFLFNTVMTPECAFKIREATLLGHPGVDGIAYIAFKAVDNQTAVLWDDHCKRFIGALVACLAEANGMARTGIKKSAQPPFSKGELYRVVEQATALPLLDSTDSGTHGQADEQDQPSPLATSDGPANPVAKQSTRAVKTPIQRQSARKQKQQREDEGGCYYMENGKKCDAAIHDEILNSLTPEEEEEVTKMAYDHAVKRGISPELARKMYLEPETF